MQIWTVYAIRTQVGEEMGEKIKSIALAVAEIKH
jgi:hypothetical protein